MKNKTIKQKGVPIYHVVQQFLNARHDKKECARTAANMKYCISGSVLSQSLDSLFKTSTYYKDILWGNLFPKTVSELGEGNSYFFKSENILGDFSWLYILVSKNHSAISEYVIFRDQIEKDILLGYYDNALLLLDNIKRKFGFSIWYYEMKLLIYSYSGNEKKSLELLTDINKEKENAKHGFVTFLLSYLYKRCSKTYSAFAFDSELENKFRMNRTEFQKDRYSYYLFRLNFYKSYQMKDLSPVLIMEATNSLIDRYNIFVNLIKALFANSETLIEKKTYSSISVKFYRKSGDPQLASLVAYANTKCLSQNYYNSDYIDLLEDYYKGEYSPCIEKCRSFVTNVAPYFDILKIYCRSLIALGKGFVPICLNQDSILNQISRYLYLAMTKYENDEILASLYQIDKNIYGLELACGLDYYLYGENSQTREALKRLSLSYFDPLFCNVFEEDEDKGVYLDSGANHIRQSLVNDYQKKRNDEDVMSANGIAKYIIDIDSAKIAFRNQDYERALTLWQSVLSENKFVLPIVQCAIEYIYRCYECLDKKQEAISFFVKYYLKGKAYTNQIDTSTLIETLYHEKYKKGVKSGLDLQLFVFLNAKEDERKSAVLERFCYYKDVCHVADLIPELEADIHEDREKVELYLYLLASEDILRHMVYITSTKMMLEEQQRIAQYLSSLIDSQNADKYSTLNQEILDTMVVYQSIKKIDESKIYVNQSALMKYDFKEYEGLYNQFKIQLANSAPTNSFMIVNTISDWTDISEDSSVISTKVKFTSKPFVDSVCQVFTSIRDKFLFSKFGLKTYLSTSIRHGVLEGVLRSGYDGLHLLLTTENNKYMPIQYWKAQYGLTSEEQKNLMKALEKFSRGVNTTIDTFKEEALQIKVEDEDKGMFNYQMTSDDMCYATVACNYQAKDYEDFCMLLMEYLLKMADGSLVQIRRDINNSLKETFNKLVDNLSQDIQIFSDNHFYNELSTAVTSARTETIQKMAHIEKWFHLQDAKFDDFSLVKQMRAVWSITSKMYPNIIENLEFSGPEYEIVIKSAYVIHISDMLTIFYNNMFSYSKVESIRPFKIKVIREGDSVRILFENNIKEDEGILNDKFKEMLKLDNRLQMEGKSGLVKVKKIIKAELGCEQNQLDIKAENGKCEASVLINLKDICVINF
ncbi:MAG: hypothetical protein GX416_01820 [Bacteroidales bacterium]|nr:hypothetical protein [Bacteroidales bacterium]